MAITKTDFINYTRCNRYVALEKIKKEKLFLPISEEEYKKLEEKENLKEIYSEIFDDNIELEKKDTQLEAMLNYYKQIEIEAGNIANNLFGGKSIYNLNNFNQKSFSCSINEIKYFCYVDIYNEQSDNINIIEVKATTTKKYKKLQYGTKDKKYPLFVKKNGIFEINTYVDEDIKDSYLNTLNKLCDRFSPEGKYIYDIAVQRYIIENYFKENNFIKNINYYLAVLNDSYVYDGYMKDNRCIYRNQNGEGIISFINVTDITEKLQDTIDKERKKLEYNIYHPNFDKCLLGKYCALKSNSECLYKSICYKDVPNINNSFSYINFRGFKDLLGKTYDKYDLINNGYLKLDDIPYQWLTNVNHVIQRDCYDNDKVYINKEKIKAFIENLQYPIYYLDFESFPCPLPRFKGESPYTQSCFEFSLHIEKSPGVCDKIKDNYIFLAKTLNDEREELIKALIKNIDINKGTMLAQNVSFEKGRLKELAYIFPKYRDYLLKIRDMGYDLLYILKNNENIALSLGFEDDSKTINYYNSKQSGSYSIKKTLPLFSSLTYSSLDIKNGTDALVSYSKYNLLTEEEKNKIFEDLKIYCRQDTFAMFEILNGLRKIIK